MNISLPDPRLQTLIFELVLAIGLIASAKILIKLKFIDQDQTDELKGFAILAVIFSHVGFFVFDNQKFLEPLSWLSGAGVNLFLFVSGYGLTLSAMKKPLSIIQFYRKRLLRLFIPLWLTITIFYLLDKVLLNRTYSRDYMIDSYLGFYPSAHLFQDLNSPLWYFTIILFFYLLFPLVTWSVLRYVAPFIMIAVARHVLTFKLEVKESVFDLYHLHFLAFPLGMMFAMIKPILPTLKILANPALRLIILFSALFALNYYTVHAGVGTTLYKEHLYALVNMFLIILIVWMLPFRLRLLSLFGQFSYELYLLHWPIMARYSDFYQTMPASIATILYLALLLGLSWLLQKFVKQIPT